MNIGIDIDGILANFTDSYSPKLTKETGIIFPKASSEWPTTWYWDREAMKAAGIPADTAKAIENKIWEGIRNSGFWGELDPLPGAKDTLARALDMRYYGHNIYFITARPGNFSKLLTENWLKENGFKFVPTVLITADKGPIARGLALDAFIDDRPENCSEVLEASHKTRVFLVDAPYNRHYEHEGVERVGSALEALNLLQRVDALVEAA